MEDMPPFTGGLVGYFSYDYIKYSEPKLKLGEHEDPDFRDMDLMLFDQVIAFDHYRQKVLLITGVMLDEPGRLLTRRQRKKLAGNGRSDSKWRKRRVSAISSLAQTISPQFPKEKYCKMVEKAKHYIHEGRYFSGGAFKPDESKSRG